MKISFLKIICFGILTATFMLLGCSKHSEKIADTYIGGLNANDTLVSNDAKIIIEREANNTVSVVSDLFQTYVVEIDKKRYFSSKTYFSVDPNENLEVSEDGVMILIHTDSQGNKFDFVGSRN